MTFVDPGGTGINPGGSGTGTTDPDTPDPETGTDGTDPPGPIAPPSDADGDGWPDNGTVPPSLPWDTRDPSRYWLTMWPNWMPAYTEQPTGATLATLLAAVARQADAIKLLELQLAWTNTILSGIVGGDVARVERVKVWRGRVGADAGVPPPGSIAPPPKT